MFRRHLIAAGFALPLCLSGVHAADVFPDKPIRIIVASAAGGASDIVARLMADRLQHSLGQPVIVEGLPGANGNIAAELLA
jgi:tripartite-type tricarboxylate transporter receptor subunit TctC